MSKSHSWYGDKKGDSRHGNRPQAYGNKFYVTRIERLPEAIGLSALRRHNSEGDEIERTPASKYPESGSVTRTYGGEKDTPHHQERGTGQIGLLTKYLDHLRHDVGWIDDDLLDSGLKGSHDNGATKEDLRDAIIFAAKDDEYNKNTHVRTQ